MSFADTDSARRSVHPMLWAIIGIMIGAELVFAAVDAGLLPEGLGRWPVYQRLAFFDLHRIADGYVRAAGGVWWEPRYDLVGPWVAVTFISHAFLHGGWLHLALNGAAFLGLGHALVQAVGIIRFLVIFLVCAAVGAMAFWLIAESDLPMVGASGAIFGMLAVLTAWQERSLRLAGRSRAMIWRRIGGLVVLNVALALGLGGLLAWQAHLGGWIAGWVMAWAIRPPSQRSRVETAA